MINRYRANPHWFGLFCPNDAGETALDLAAANNNQEIVKMIFDEVGVWQEELHTANNFMSPLNKIILGYLFGRITGKANEAK